MSQYIAVLWPSHEDAVQIETYRQEICRGCDAAISLTWPVHLTLFYGIRTQDRKALAHGFQKIALATPALNLRIAGIGAWNESLVYLKIAPCPGLLELQTGIRETVKRVAPLIPGEACHKPGGTEFSGEELRNIHQWGTHYPFRPHLTLARNLTREHCAQVVGSAKKLRSLVPPSIIANRLSVEVFGEGELQKAGTHEDSASFDLTPRAPAT